MVVSVRILFSGLSGLCKETRPGGLASPSSKELILCKTASPPEEVGELSLEVWGMGWGEGEGRVSNGHFSEGKYLYLLHLGFFLGRVGILLDKLLSAISDVLKRSKEKIPTGVSQIK